MPPATLVLAADGFRSVPLTLDADTPERLRVAMHPVAGGDPAGGGAAGPDAREP